MPGMSMHVHSVLLSGVAGYVDAAGFIALIGLFPAHVTGELIGEALAFTSGHLREHMTRLWVLPVFVGSVMTATLVARARRRKGQRALTGLLVLVTGALAMFSVSDALSRVLHEGPHLAFLLSGGSAVAAMAFQNSLMRESLAASCPTTVMTGNLTQVIIDIVDYFTNKLMRPGKRDRRPRGRLGSTAASFAAFTACAVLGGCLARYMGSLSVALPALVTFSLAVVAWREDRKRYQATALVGRINAAPPLPSFDVWPESLRTPTAADAERPALKRTVSGTQLSTRFRDGK
jgi:uncharacterized membrane protein YoaK (UPF0700 family)